ncbi:MAG: hypothetical protein ACI9Z3_002075 [Roseivirga sp.]|jgi:hypothetical protein
MTVSRILTWPMDENVFRMKKEMITEKRMTGKISISLLLITLD